MKYNKKKNKDEEGGGGLCLGFGVKEEVSSLIQIWT